MIQQNNFLKKSKFKPKFQTKFQFKFGQILLFLTFLNPNLLLAKTELYTFETLLDYTLKNSPNLQISKLGIDEAKIDYDIAKSNFYPTIYFGANSEYSDKFDNGYSPSYIGDSSLVQDTAYQNSLSLNLRYDIFKFGADYYNAKSAKTHINTTTFQKCNDELETALNLLKLYHEALSLKHQINSNNELKQAYEILANYATRLNTAGQMDKIEQTQYSSKLSQTKSNLLTLQNRANLVLNQIYEISNLQISNLNDLAEFDTQSLLSNIKFIDFEDSFISKKLKSEIEENALNLKSLERSLYPTISLYAKYDLYGSDTDSYTKAHKDTHAHGYRVGLSINYEIFDGGRKNSQIKKQEIINKKLEFEKQNQKLKFQKEQRDIMGFLETKNELEKTLSAINNESQKIKNSVSRLNSVGERSKIELINSLITTIEAKAELQEHILKSNFTLKKAGLIAEQSKKCE